VPPLLFWTTYRSLTSTGEKTLAFSQKLPSSSGLVVGNRRSPQSPFDPSRLKQAQPVFLAKGISHPLPPPPLPMFFPSLIVFVRSRASTDQSFDSSLRILARLTIKDLFLAVASLQRVFCLLNFLPPLSSKRLGFSLSKVLRLPLVWPLRGPALQIEVVAVYLFIRSTLVTKFFPRDDVPL